MTTSLGLVDAFEKAAQIRRNRSRGLRDLSLFSPVAANRDAAAGAETPSVRVTRDTRTEGSSSEPAAAGLGQMSSVGGETRSEHAAPVVLTVGGSTLDSLPLVVHEAPGVSGPAVHVGHVAARAVTDGGPRLGEAS